MTQVYIFQWFGLNKYLNKTQQSIKENIRLRNLEIDCWISSILYFWKERSPCFYYPYSYYYDYYEDLFFVLFIAYNNVVVTEALFCQYNDVNIVFSVYIGVDSEISIACREIFRDLVNEGKHSCFYQCSFYVSLFLH